MKTVSKILSVALILILSSCAHKPDLKKKNLVLIGGSHLDETSWQPFIQHLDPSRFTTQALPRLGRNADNPSHLKDVAEMLCAKITTPSAIVAHSFGGALVNSMIRTCATKITEIIYVAALIPLNNETPTTPLKNADQKQYMSAVDISKTRISPKSPAAFYQAMDSGLKEPPASLPPVYAESMMTLGDSVQFLENDFKAIPKFYVFTSQDKIIAMEFQRKMAGRIQLVATATIATGHLPMLSQPQQLAQIVQSFLK